MSLPVPLHGELLSVDQQSTLDSLGESLGHAYRVRQIWRTETEMRVSVLNDLHFPTPAAKYWQCIREQCVFLEQLSQLAIDFRRNDVKLRRARKAWDDAQDELDKDDAQITIDECTWLAANMRLQADDRIREILLWERLKGEQVAADPTFDRDDVNAHQLVSYTTQFVKRAAHSDPAALTGGELDNLVGLLSTSIARCIDTGVLDRVRMNLSPDLCKVLDGNLPSAPQLQ